MKRLLCPILLTLFLSACSGISYHAYIPATCEQITLVKEDESIAGSFNYESGDTVWCIKESNGKYYPSKDTNQLRVKAVVVHGIKR